MGNERAERIALSVPSDFRYGEAVRAMLDALSKRLEKDTGTPGLNHQVISAFSEAFNNVVWHSYGGRRTEKIEIDVEIDARGITITLADRGESFDLEKVEDPDLVTMPEGGLGIWIIRSLMTHVEYQRGDRNVFTMVKDFSQPLVFSDEDQPVV